MSILLAVVSALLFGTADFTGGVASRRNAIPAVLVWSQLAGLFLVLIYALTDGVATAGSITAMGRPPFADLAYGALAGVAGLGGLAFLYRGLARGLVAIVSPLAAVGGALIPLGAGILFGEMLTARAGLGVGLSLLAILLVSWHGQNDRVISAGSSDVADHHGVRVRVSWRDGTISGVLFGLFFVSISQASTAGGLWPLAAARLASISLLIVGAFFTRRTVRLSGGHVTVIAAGLLDMGANIALLLAYGGGYLSLVTVVASSYPAQTVLLSRLILGERIGPVRLAGIGIAIAGIAFISLG